MIAKQSQAFWRIRSTFFASFSIIIINLPLMKLTKNQLKTWNSQQSDIDMFSKLENTFLQKFFRLNLIDYFDDTLSNIYETKSTKKINNKNNKVLLNHFFQVQKSFMIHEFEQKVHSFYKHKSKSFQNGELQHVFKIRYCNWNPVPNFITKGQLVMFDIKIKADIQKLESMPQKAIQIIQNACSASNYLEDEIMKKTFENYNAEYLNIFIVYFGDINFHLVRKQNYERQNVKLFEKKVKLRIFTFYVSKQALLQTFRSMNKITTLDHINDLVIQFYELKREKRNQKKRKQKQKQNKEKDSSKTLSLKSIQQYSDYIKYIAGGILVLAAVCVGSYKLNAVSH